MKRVLFIDHVTAILGGAEINLIELLGAPEAQTHWKVACACARGGPLSVSLESAGVAQFDYTLPGALNRFRLVQRIVSPWNTARALFAAAHARRRLEAIAAEFQPDVTVSCTNKDALLLGSAARRLHVPAVWWVNDIFSADFFSWPVRRWFVRKARHASRVVVVSRSAAAALESGGLPASRITTIHNGIPLSRYERKPAGALHTLLRLPNDEPLIGIVGRFTPWKGQALFLEVARTCIEQNLCPGHFVLIGRAFNEDQAFENELRSFVRTHGLTDRVHFIPFQSAIAECLSDLDLLIHASIRPEPFGRVIIEAMAVGTPVIAAAAGGVLEILNHGKTGLLAEPGDAASFISALNAFTKMTAEQRSAMTAAARQRVQNEFTLERVWSDFDRLFDVLLKPANRRPLGTSAA